MPDMPSFEKSPPELVERFRSTVESIDGAERRQMFGYPALFVGGNLVTSLFADSWSVRLADADRAELLAVDGARTFEPMAGRPMREYVVLPPAVLADDAALAGWIDRAVAYGRSLPPKEPKAKKPAGSKRAG